MDRCAQGQAIGGALLENVGARCDEAGAPCVLETEDERNVVFYERRGSCVSLSKRFEPLVVPASVLGRKSWVSDS